MFNLPELNLVGGLDSPRNLVIAPTNKVGEVLPTTNQNKVQINITNKEPKISPISDQNL